MATVTKVLTVDDARAIRALVRKALKGDFAIEEAVDGQAGLAKVEEFAPDVILLDVTMPVMGGSEMLERLRASGDETPVIILSSERESSIIEPMLAQRAVFGIVRKPFKPAWLLEAIAKVVESDGGANAFPRKVS